jgi:NAD(P)-dependent dehydrogenase (short-subunit alcohol dehydrogenase family)
MRFQNKTAIVTGAGSGIGRAIASRLATEGAKITIADANVEGSEQTASMVGELGRQALVTETDVTDASSVRSGNRPDRW